MGGFKHLKKSGFGERTPGKIDASLNEKLKNVEWGEYKLGDLFYVHTYKKRFDANKVTVLDKGQHPYIVRMSGNNGQKGFIDAEEKYLNEGNTLSFGQDTATVFYQEKPYFTGDKIKILKSKNECFGKKNSQFFVSAITKAFSSFSWGTSSYSIDVIENQPIKLPTKNNEPDFDFMESFVAELEAERVAELSAYLKVSGLDNYELSSNEKKALQDFMNNKIEYGEFSYSKIFDHIKQGRRLKKEDQIPGEIPFIMAGTTNTGLVNYISNPVATFPKNSITIDIFGNTFYRNYSFGAGDDTGVYWNSKTEYSKGIMLFFASAMKKSIKGKFSYGKKLRSSQSYNFKMILPINQGEIDFDFIEKFICAIQKLVIKDIVLYADRKISATKSVINKKQDK